VIGVTLPHIYRGFNTDSTSSVLILSTGSRRRGAAYSRSVFSHCAACLLLRYEGRIASNSRSAHSPDVALFVAGLAPFGLIPSASLPRASPANSRARASGTSRAEPNPISVGLPCQR